MKPFSPPKPPDPIIGKSFTDVLNGVKNLWQFIKDLVASLITFSNSVTSAMTPLYGELKNSSPSGILNGAQSISTVTVTNAILGWRVQATYDKDLQGLVMTAYVSAADTVKIILFNNTGGTITLTAGVFRVWVWPEILSSTVP